MPHLNKSQKRQQRMTKRHPQAALPNAALNNFLILPNSKSFTNHTFIAGPNQAALEAFQEFPIITAASQELASATGEPREVT